MIVYRLKSYSSTSKKKNWDEEDEFEDYVDGLKKAQNKGIGSALETGILLGGNGYFLKRSAKHRRDAEQFVKNTKNGTPFNPEDLKKANKMLRSKINKSKAAIGRVIEKYPKTAAGIVASASLISGIKEYKDKTGKLERDLNRKYRGRFDRYPEED